MLIRRILVIGMINVLTVAFAQPHTLFVSPDGNDAGPGTQERPFATLQGARDAIRALKQAGPLPDGGVTVYLREGLYEVSTTFVLDAQDSGTPEAPIVYRAFEGEQPVIRLAGA